jgi:hypothetical protein
MKNLVLKVTLVSCALLGTSVAKAQDHAQCYNLASIKGSYASVATYGANIALGLGVRYFDGNGNFTATFLVNEPDPASTTGGRKIVTGTQVGTFTVNCDGSGQIVKTTTTSTGVVSTSTDDFVITAAKRIHGQLIATAIEDAQGIPSAIVAGGVFVIHHLTRRPDSDGSDGDQNQQ